jgi:hypothetical protein
LDFLRSPRKENRDESGVTDLSAFSPESRRKRLGNQKVKLDGLDMQIEKEKRPFDLTTVADRLLDKVNFSQRCKE